MKKPNISELIRLNLYPFLIFSLVNLGVLTTLLTVPRFFAKRFVHGYGDPALYLWIAKSGYSLTHCPAAWYKVTDWCGNAGWQPFYPLLIRILSFSTLSPSRVGLIVTEVFTLLLTLLIWSMLGKVHGRHRYFSLLVAALFPGMIYLYSIFPISLLLFLMVLTYKALSEKKYLIASIAAFLVPLTYSSGIMIIAVLAIWTLLQKIKGKKWKPGAIVTSAAAFGFFVFLAIMQLSVGNWRAEFLVQAKYGNGLHNPLQTLFINTNPQSGAYFSISNIVALQATLVLFVIICLAATVYNNRRKLTEIDWLVSISTLVYFITPLVVGVGISSYRSSILLLPSVLLFKYMPKWLVYVLFILFILLAYGLTRQVILGKLL